MAELEALKEAGEDVALVLAARVARGRRRGASCWERCVTSTRTLSEGC